MDDHSEASVRRILHRELKLRHWWIEAAQGGTPGLPDLIAVKDGRLIMIELKRFDKVQFGLRFKLRNAQVRVANAALESSVPFIVLGPIDLREISAPVYVHDRPAIIAHRLNERVPNRDGLRIVSLDRCRLLPHHRDIDDLITGLAG